MNATQLLADIKRKAQIAADPASLTDLDILDIATKELQTVITPKILSVRERYFAAYTDFALTTSRIYRIPDIAVGNKLLQLEYIETVGSNQSQRDLNFVSPINNPRLEGFHIRNSSVILTAYAPSTGTLRMHYAIRPGALTETKTYIDSIIDNTIFTVASVTGFTDLDYISIQKSSSPYEYVLVSTQIAAVTVISRRFEVADTTKLSIGDVVTLHHSSTDFLTHNTNSFYPQIPDELHDWLALRTVVRILESLGHTELLNLHQGKLRDMEKDILAIITPRVDGSPKVINGGELLGWQD